MLEEAADYVKAIEFDDVVVAVAVDRFGPAVIRLGWSSQRNADVTAHGRLWPDSPEQHR